MYWRCVDITGSGTSQYDLAACLGPLFEVVHGTLDDIDHGFQVDINNFGTWFYKLSRLGVNFIAEKIWFVADAGIGENCIDFTKRLPCSLEEFEDVVPV